MKRWGSWIGLLSLFLVPAVAAAQTGPELMLKPWPAGEAEQGDTQFQVDGQVRHSWDGEVESSDRDFDLTRYDAGGRYRVNAKRGAPAVGYDLTYLDLDTASPALPDRLLDTSAAFGFGLGKWQGWSVAGTVGGGFAGDTPFSDDDAWYGKANLIANKKIDKKRSVYVGLNYDGNRVIWPDVPLPIAAYNERVSETFRYSLGVPVSSVQWQPSDRLTLEASTVVLVDFSAEARYRLHEKLIAFAGYDSDTTAFHRDGGREHRRLFYKTRRLEGGVKLPCPEMPGSEVVIAGGYAFDREFERGFDVRDLDTVRDVSDSPYIRAAIDFSF
jgi:hypothetical protein